MANYSVQDEAMQALLNMVNDERMGFSSEVKQACKKVKFHGDDKPFLPTPMKMTESVSALSALVGVCAEAIVNERYGQKQDVSVNTDKATLFLLGILLPTVDGTSISKVETITKTYPKTDLYQIGKPIHRQASNIYQCKDGRWYHIHESMNANPTMKMMGVPDQDVTNEEARQIFMDKVAQWESDKLDIAANEEHRQAGTICYTPEEFFATEQGSILAKEAPATVTSIKAAKKPWPKVNNANLRPLAGIRVIDLSRAVAAPAVSKLLAVLGADVIKVGFHGLPDTASCILDINTGKRDVDINLKSDEGKETFKKILKDADVLIDGYRPKAFEKLGFSASSLREINPSLIYVRECCYGYKGPWCHRSGWQQIADCLVGLSWLQGKFMGLNEPIVPLLPNADYQAGVLGAALVVQALQKRANEDVTFNIDVSLAQYNIWLYRLGQYDEQQRKAILARNPGFHIRHYDEMGSMFEKMIAAINVSRPGLIQNQDLYITMSGKEWGVGDIKVLGAPFSLSKSRLDYQVPSGPRGWATNNIAWLAVN